MECCPNPECGELTLAVGVSDGVIGDDHFGGRSAKPLAPPAFARLIPDSVSKPQPDYIPQALRDDYYEACKIRDLSPKTAATLARRCLQGIIQDFWGISGKTLYAEINELQTRIDAPLWGAIDAVRKVGNIGAHM